MEITDRGLLYPVLGLATATSFVLAFQLTSGRYPHPVLIANLYLVGLGIGLVVARVGRLGPYGGFLGSPWKETMINTVVARESARALRFGRDLTIVGAQLVDSKDLDLRQVIRATDQLIDCRNGWKVIVLPETDSDGARMVLHRLYAETAIVSGIAEFDRTRPRQQLDMELVQRLRVAAPSRSSSRHSAKPQDSHALAG